MYHRLKELRKSLGLTQEAFGQSVGVAKSTYNNYEVGKRDPDSEFWIAVAKTYHVSIDYLMGYSDDPHPAVSVDTKKSPAEVSPQGANETKLLNYYRSMNPDGKARLIELAELLSEKYRKEEQSVGLIG